VTGWWRRLADADLAAVAAIGAVVHAAYPERPEVAAERLRLFPAGCRAATDAAGAVLGYALAHPWRLGAPPALDTLLGRLPEPADCLYLHDVALVPSARGAGLGAALVPLLRRVAAAHGLARLALVAVHGSAPWWARFGFAPSPSGEHSAGLASYGATAAYLVASAAEPR
jgi:GNAT superfamily N-acetyltransferase